MASSLVDNEICGAGDGPGHRPGTIQIIYSLFIIPVFNEPPEGFFGIHAIIFAWRKLLPVNCGKKIIQRETVQNFGI